MIKNLFLVIALCMSGCIIYVDDNHRHSDTHRTDDDQYGWLWLEDPYITCYYDGYWDLSEWYIEISANTYNGFPEVAYVGFYINNYDYQEMGYAGNGLWNQILVSNYYDCDRSLHFDFVAADYEGHETVYTYYW